VIRLNQQRTELFALPFASTNRERPERDTMIALAAGDDETPSANSSAACEVKKLVWA
jgi:hypothetical protein